MKDVAGSITGIGQKQLPPDLVGIELPQLSSDAGN